MNAIIVTGGKQYKVAEGDTLFSEKLEAEAGPGPSPSTRCWPLLDGDKATFGAPTVAGASCGGHRREERQGQEGPHLRSTPPKKGYRKRQGHRQPYTKVQIGAIKA